MTSTRAGKSGISRGTFLKGAAGLAGAALASGWTPAAALQGGVLVPGAAPIRGHLDAGTAGHTLEFPVDYPGNSVVWTVEAEIRPDNGQTLSLAGFKIYNPTGSIQNSGGIQTGLVPNVSADLINTQPGRYVVQVYNYNATIPIDFQIRVRAGRTEGQPLPATQSLQQALSGPWTVYVGTYTEPAPRKGEGIPIFHADPSTGGWTPSDGMGGVRNPSFLAIDPRQDFLYSVNEVSDMGGDAKSGGVSAFAVQAGSGALTPLNQKLSGGADPAHISVDPHSQYVLVANYTGSTVEVLPIQDDGSLGDPTDLVKHSGTLGPNAARQEAPHPHMVAFDPAGRFILVPDLGLDTVFVYQLDYARGKLNAVGSAGLKPGSGPRHFAFHPNGQWLYVISELASTITTFAYDQGTGAMTEVQSVSTLPKDFSGTSTTAEVKVHQSGRFVYGSNRGHDSIAIFTVEPNTGGLTPIWWEPTQGKTPRMFEIEPNGNFLYVANQDSNNIVPFAIDQGTGRLVPILSAASVGTPVCILFARP